MYRITDLKSSEVKNLQEKLCKAEVEIAKLKNKKALGERMSNWWQRNKPSFNFLFGMSVVTILAVLVVVGSMDSERATCNRAHTEAQAVAAAVQRFHSPRVAVRCFNSPEHGMLCELRHQQDKVLVRCDTETCWDSQ